MRIPGLTYIRNYVSQRTHDDLLHVIDKSSWNTELRRRTQHYGYKYDYRARKIDMSMALGPLPPWCQQMALSMQVKGVFTRPPDQVIVNEYLPGQGITRHVDCQPCFQGVIASLSLGSGCIMEMTECNSNKVIPIYLEPRSLLILQDEARYGWMHAIPARASDEHAGKVWTRKRRVSMTFRNVILE